MTLIWRQKMWRIQCTFYCTIKVADLRPCILPNSHNFWMVNIIYMVRTDFLRVHVGLCYHVYIKFSLKVACNKGSETLKFPQINTNWLQNWDLLSMHISQSCGCLMNDSILKVGNTSRCTAHSTKPWTMPCSSQRAQSWYLATKLIKNQLTFSNPLAQLHPEHRP